MKPNKNCYGLVLCCYVLLICHTAFCQVRLPLLVSDGMVLQRDAQIKVWGWADAGEKVTLDFNGKTTSATAGTDGKWMVSLEALKAGGPYVMEIKADNHITLTNILIGDVWICSGQSNMELPMARVKDKYPDVIAACDNDQIRQFLVPDRYNFKSPQEDFESGNWVAANPKSVLDFTAVGYFFAKALYEKYHVPIGLINTSLGGSPAQAWLSEDALKAFPNYLEIAEKYKDDAYIKQVKDKDKSISDAWYTKLQQLDQGLVKDQKPWFDPSYDAFGWASMKIPAYWEEEGLGKINGVVWFRKEINVPASMVGKPARITLGAIVDSDTVYINGTQVGTTSYQYPPRKYDFAKNVLKEGKNIITIRVVNNTGRGGFVKNKAYELTAAGQTIDLKGPWQYKLGAVMDPLPGPTFIQWQPLGLYNSMIAPLLNCTVKGVIWYQGESNTGNPSEYQKLFPAMIANWRAKWNQGDFPFLYVQLANFMQTKDQPSESNWAALREAQLKTLAVPNTAMAVITDIGEWNDIHPLNKEDVGKRLALAAQKLAYGDNTAVYSGPIYQSMKIQGSKIILTFTQIGGGLIAKGDGQLKYFAIAGADKKFVWAQTKIENDKIIVWNDQVTNPVAVRYAWADNPQGSNLYNKEGLPASCFRTDE
jgi:sialate O-acetylesterase